MAGEVPFQRFSRRPLWLLRRQLAKLKGDPEVIAHVRLWMDDIEAQVGDDPKQQAVVRSAIVAYVQCQRLEDVVLKMEPHIDGFAEASMRVATLAEKVAKLLRLAGLKGKGTKGKARSEDESGFTPPRERRPSELAAESLPADGSDGDD